MNTNISNNIEQIILKLNDPTDVFEDWVRKLKRIEREYQTKLRWCGDFLGGDQLISAIKSQHIKAVGTANIEKIYLETTDKQGKIIMEEHYYTPPSSSQKNAVYERTMSEIIKKDDAINAIDVFTNCFNRLDKLARTILYYSFFKKESSLKVSQLRLSGEMTYSPRSVLRKKHEAVERLVKMLCFTTQFPNLKSQSIKENEDEYVYNQ